MRPLPVFVAFTLAACLSSPSPKDGDGNGDGGASDASADGPDDVDFPFPGARSMTLRAVEPADLDGDDVDELYIVNSSMATDDRGVYIFDSPQSDPTDLRYTRFINTTAVPYHVAFYDVVASPALDLIVLGKRDALDDFVIEVYEQEDGGGFAAVGSRIVDGFRPDPLFPIIIELGALTGSVLNDVVVADISGAQVFLVPDTQTDFVAGLGAATSSPLGRDGSAATAPFDNSINGLLARNVDGGVDDLLVIENNIITWLGNNGAGTFVQDSSFNNNSFFPIFTFQEVDFDGIPPNDLIGGGLLSVGAWFIEPDVGTTITAESAVWQPHAADLSDLAWGEVDGELRAEAVTFLVGDVGGGDGQLLIYLGAQRVGQSTDMGPASPIVHDVSPAPDLGVVFDFDRQGDSEIWFFSTTGAAGCVTFVNAAPADC